MKKKIVLIPIGGTIAAKVLDRTSAVYLSGKAGIEATLAGLGDLSTIANLEIQKLLVDGQEINCHSSSLTQAALLHLSHLVSVTLKRPDVAGVIVTQGTDTLEETAFFLQLTVKSSKPVVVTGAMRPFEYGSPDGPDNIRCAVKYILNEVFPIENQNYGVVVAFQFKVFSAFNVTKVLSYPPTVKAQSEHLPCPFVSFEFGPIAEISKSGTGLENWNLNWNSGSRFFTELSMLEKLKFSSAPDAKLPVVPIVSQYLGNDSDRLIVDWYLAKFPEISCFILEGNGNGSISERMKSIVNELKSKRDLAFIRSSKVAKTWCIDDQLNYPGTIGAQMLSSVQARILAQLVILNSKGAGVDAITKIFTTGVPAPRNF